MYTRSLALFVLCFWLCLPVAFAQEEKITISGTVTDSETGELVVGAALYVAAQDLGVTTNQYGYYSLTVAGDSVSIIIQHIAYTPQVLTYRSREDLIANISLVPATLSAGELEVTASESILQATQMSVISLPVQDVETLPTILGESDVLRIIQLLPGVQSGVEGSTGLYVRGGGPDQNLYLLDGTQIYNPTHIFGFLGTFNSDAIKDVRVLKGGFPARYGGRLSSVIDLTMKEGNMKKFTGTSAVGLLASRLTLEGPIKRDRASFLVSARRSYADLLARPFIDQSEEDFGYHFYDVNVKANIILTSKDRIYLSGYAGSDVLYTEFNHDDGDEDRGQLSWRNLTTTLRWNHIFGPRLFTNVLIGYTNYDLRISSRYQYRYADELNTYEDSYASGIQDLHGRIDSEFLPSSNHSIRFGVGVQEHDFLTGAYEAIYQVNNMLQDSTNSGNRRTQATEFQAYIEDDWRLSSKIRLNTGVHASSFLIGKQTYVSIEPRLSGLFRVTPRTSLKASVALMQQYIHLLSTTSGLSLPTDLWVPATEKVRPQKSWQVAGGIVRAFGDGKFELSAEVYYKQMQNLIEYKDGSNFFEAAFGSWEDRVVAGKGVAYGGELFFQKKSGRTTGWIGYTLSWSNRKFNEINDGQWFPYRYDRRNDISLVLNHNFSSWIDLSVAWVYGTGQAITLPVGYVIAEPNTWVAFPWAPTSENIFYRVQSARNGARMPHYHRMDLGLRFHRTMRYFKRTLSLGTYNTYNRRNAVSIYAIRENNSNNVTFKKFSLLPIVPAISYQIKF